MRLHVHVHVQATSSSLIDDTSSLYYRRQFEQIYSSRMNLHQH